MSTMDSPFTTVNPNKNKRELTFIEKLCKWSYDKLNDFYVSAIPSDDVKAMPPEYMYPIGGVILIILLGIFFGIFLPSYMNAVNVKYLEPGVTSSEYCDEVTVSNSGEYLATNDGLWIGETNFTYCNAAYVFSVENYEVTNTEFAQVMNMIYQRLVFYGSMLNSQNLGVNLLFWMTLTFTSTNNNAQRFYLVGSPTTIFNRQKTVGTLSNVNGDCRLAPTSSFDAANALLTVQYNYKDFMNDPICNSTVTPSMFGYTSTSNADVLEAQIDIRSLITAHALNVGVLMIDTLTEIITYRTYIDYNGDTYLGRSFVNPNFPGMAPIFCIMYENTPHCVLQIGEIYGIPIYNHAGASLSWPVPCDCATLTQEELDDKFNYCNIFQFITAFVFYNTPSSVPIITLGTSQPGINLNAAAFNATYIGSMWGLNSINYTELNAPSMRAEAFQFCNLSGWSCSILTFSSYDMVPGDYVISEYFYSVPNGACRDTISPSYANWSLLIDTPFSPLTQPYSECRNSPTTVFMNQAGSAVGNVSILSPFGVLLVLILIGLYQNVTGRAIPRTYSRTEKDQALDAFAAALLAARDERRKQKIDPSRKQLDTLVFKLVNELADAADSGEGAIQYKTDESAEKFEIDWSAILGSIFGSGGGSSKKHKEVSGRDSSSNNNAVELSSLESSPHGDSRGVGVVTTLNPVVSKVMFMNKKSLPTHVRGLLVLNAINGVSEGTLIPVSELRESLHDYHTTTGERLSSTASVRSRLIHLKKSTDSNQLFRETMAALDELIGEFKQAYIESRTKPSITSSQKEQQRQQLGEQELISPLHSRQSDFWPLLVKTLRLHNGVEALSVFGEILDLTEQDRDEDDEVDSEEQEEDEEQQQGVSGVGGAGGGTSVALLNKLVRQIYKKVLTLMLVHTALTQHCDDINSVFVQYNERVAYSINGMVLSMKEVKEKSET